MAQVSFIKYVAQSPNSVEGKGTTFPLAKIMNHVHCTKWIIRCYSNLSMIFTLTLHSPPSLVTCAWTASIPQPALIYCIVMRHDMIFN